MHKKQISFDFGINVPIQFSIVESPPSGSHWHPQLEIVYVLNGEDEIIVNDQRYILKEDQLLVINPYTIHSVINDNCSMGVFLINLTMFDQTLVRESVQIDCNSITIANEDELFPIKHLLAQIIKSNISAENNKHNELLNKSLAYALIYELITKYAVNEDEDYKKRRSQMNRMEDIVKYIHQHFTESLTLKQISEHFFLTIPYLSRIFKKYINMNFTEYLYTIRLTHAINYLSNPSITIDEIAEICGFPNTRSFVTTFKRQYNMNPSAYRNIQKTETRNTTNNNLELIQQNHLSVLAKYLTTDNSPNTQSSFPQLFEISPIDIMQKGFPLKHNFKNMIGIGKAKHLLYADIQRILTETQLEIGFSYITFYGLLDDDMMLYSEDNSGTPRLNFQYIDSIIDFLLSINLKPFMQLSFMPKALAKTPERTMFYHPSIISIPNSMEKWRYLVVELTKHLQNRYTAAEVESWPFCVWNEPDSPSYLFGFANKEEYFHLHKVTYEAVKKCNPNIAFGTPSLICESLEEMDWFTDFMDFCNANNCTPEFLNYHFFPLRLENKKIDAEFINSSTLRYRESPDALKESIYLILKNLKQQDFKFSNIYMTEWNSSISHCELINDTAFKTTYIVKNILENIDRLDSFSYWMLSDFNDELQMPKDMFFGGLGLITSNGVKKASYYAFYLLTRLGDNLIGKGNGYFVTKMGNSFQIILYNYQHFSKLYAQGELFDLTFTNRYTPFENPICKKYVIPLQNMPNKDFTITETIVNRNHGSSFDKWIEFGAQPIETQNEIQYLKSISQPLIKKRTVSIENNYLTISCELEPHEVRLIEIIQK